MSNTNRLLSSDNKGFAQQLLEKEWAPQQQQQLESGFVAAFAQSNGKGEGPACWLHAQRLFSLTHAT
jgi:hypothetical protein